MEKALISPDISSRVVPNEGNLRRRFEVLAPMGDAIGFGEIDLNEQVRARGQRMSEACLAEVRTALLEAEYKRSQRGRGRQTL
jgi:hypothetical protein